MARFIKCIRRGLAKKLSRARSKMAKGHRKAGKKDRSTMMPKVVETFETATSSDSSSLQPAANQSQEEIVVAVKPAVQAKVRGLHGPIHYARATLDPDVEVDEEFVELARVAAYALDYLNSPWGREPDPEGFFTYHKHTFRPVSPGQSRKGFVSDANRILIKIDSLTDIIDQNCLYDNALYQATTAEVRAQYESHCQRIKTIRSNLSSNHDAYKKEQRQGNVDFNARFCMSMTLGVGTLGALARRAGNAYMGATMAFKNRLDDKKAEEGVVRLLERCEGLLKRADDSFIPSAWRSLPRKNKRRWADGEKGWTGLVV